MIKTVIFDMDGTIVDTEHVAAEVIRSAFQKWGATLTEDDSRCCLGKKWEVAFDLLFSRHAVSVSRDEAEVEILQKYRAHLSEKLTEIPGSRDAIQSLSGVFPLGLVSGSARQDIQHVLETLGIESCFRFYLGSEDYKESKPSPQGYSKMIQMLDASPDTTLVFEDSEAGIQSAVAAGAKVVAITETHRFSVNTAGAHLRVKNLLGVDPEWVREKF